MRIPLSISSLSRWGSAKAVAACLAAAASLAHVGPTHGGDFSTGCPLPPQVEELLLNRAFKDPVYKGPLLYPEVTSLDGLSERLQGLFVPHSLFRSAYLRLETVDHRFECMDPPDCDYDALAVSYVIGEREYTGFAYYREAESGFGRHAAVIIPGTGHNQASAIYLNDERNYHYNIAELVRPNWDMYVCVKPNEDILAIHRGGAKLDYDYVVAHLANSGGSYSARYLIDTIAIVKYLKRVYSTVVLLGLSQGGQAVLYNSLQTSPAGAFVASGYSVLQDSYGSAGLDQIMIPGMREYLGTENIYDGVGRSATEYVFSWGAGESGVYRAEAAVGCTRDYFSSLRNVTCVLHDGGHEFPREQVSEFLDSMIIDPRMPANTSALYQNEPNPFISRTRIVYAVKRGGRVRLEVFDAKGRLVQVLADGLRDPDVYAEIWDGTDRNGRVLPAGTYFCRLTAPDWSGTKKMNLVR